MCLILEWLSALNDCLLAVYTKAFTRAHRSSLPTPKQIMQLFNRAGKGKGKLTCSAISPVYFLASLKFIMRQLCCKRSMLVSVLVQVRQGQCDLTVPRPSTAVTSQANNGNPSCFHRPGIDWVDRNAHNYIVTLVVPSFNRIVRGV